MSRVLGWMAVSWCVVVSSAAAAPPEVKFDVAATIPCRESTSLDFSAANPGEKLVEAQIDVSAFVGYASEKELLQFVYHFTGCEQTVQIADYWPKTTLHTDVSSPIMTERRREQGNTAGVEVDGQYTEFFSAKIGAQTTWKDSTLDRYERLPKLSLLAASGTTHRGSGVYFKLKPSPRGSLEGAKNFCLLLRVPRTWRGDLLQLSCEALGNTRGSLPPLDTAVKSTGAGFTLALYLDGDEIAKRDAQRLVAAEQELKRLAARSKDDVQSHAYPTLAHRVGAVFSLVEAKIPADWLDDVLAAPGTAPLGPGFNDLPSPLRHAVTEYRSAKREMGVLAGR